MDGEIAEEGKHSHLRFIGIFEKNHNFTFRCRIIFELARLTKNTIIFRFVSAFEIFNK